MSSCWTTVPSQISLSSQTLECVAAKQTLNYLTSDGLLSKFQSAYRCFHSTETALIRVFNDILVALDRHQEVVLVLQDLSAAFDNIDHSALLSRLQCCYGINGTMLTWFQSYLDNRTQQVIIKDSLSSEKQLLSGVPQGSVLGPLLFSHFVFWTIRRCNPQSHGVCWRYTALYIHWLVWRSSFCPWPSLSFVLRTFLFGVLQTAWHATQATLKLFTFYPEFHQSSQQLKSARPLSAPPPPPCKIGLIYKIR